jgi:hypothetical protein
MEPEKIAPLATTPPARMPTRAMQPTTNGTARLECFATGSAWSAAVSWRLQCGQTPSPANRNGSPQNGQNPAGGI